MALKLDIQNASSLNSLPNENQLNHWASFAVDENTKESEISLKIVDEAEARELNNKWRNRDYATNVLSFPVGESLEHMPSLLGDIVICAPVVEKEAKEQGKSSESHWAHLIIHGILHLQGYDHEQENDALIMEEKEILILDKIGYPNPYEQD